MARKKIIRSDIHPYHIWARSNNKESFPLPAHQCWGIFNYYLTELTSRYGFEIHSFVLMSNHFHAMISTPRANIDNGMRYFMTQTSKGIGMASQRINHVYGGPYGWTIADRSDVYSILYKYVYRNPVKAGLVTKVEEYKWSTLTNKNIDYQITRKTSHGLFIPDEKSKEIDWLNIPAPSEIENKIGVSIKSNGYFKFPKDEKDHLLSLDEYLTQPFGKGAAHL